MQWGGGGSVTETFKGLDHSKCILVVMHLVCPCDWSLLSSIIFKHI